VATGDWAPGTKVELLDVSVLFDGTSANAPVSVRAGYRIVLPSGSVLSDARTINLSPPDAGALAALQPALAALYQLVAASEGVT
jgi:hypothetical protein